MITSCQFTAISCQRKSWLHCSATMCTCYEEMTSRLATLRPMWKRLMMVVGIACSYFCNWWGQLEVISLIGQGLVAGSKLFQVCCETLGFVFVLAWNKTFGLFVKQHHITTELGKAFWGRRVKHTRPLLKAHGFMREQCTAKRIDLFPSHIGPRLVFRTRGNSTRVGHVSMCHPQIHDSPQNHPRFECQAFRLLMQLARKKSSMPR